MPLKIIVTRRGVEALTTRQQRDCLRESMRVIAEGWHDNYKLLKFAKSAMRRYNLTPRSGDPGSGRAFRGSYQWAKLKRRKNGDGAQAIGEVKPFVWSGRSRTLAMASRKVVATAKSSTRARSEAVINAPALNFKNPKSKVNAREEMERVIPAETAVLEGDGAREYSNQITRQRAQRTHVSQ
jgi:hypothetical protein